MKTLVVGLGSMGKRRVRNIQHLNEQEKAAIEIIGFDTSSERRQETEKMYGIKTVATFEEGLAAKPDALIISTPPHLHTKYIRSAIENKIHFFVELSLLSTELSEIIKNKGSLVAAPSFTMRHQESLQKIQSLIAEEKLGKKVTFIAHSGRYLPDWHPWEDYRKSFLAREDTHGCRELISFELTWIPWVFGPVRSVMATKNKISTLDLPADVYDILFEFDNGNTGHLKIDVVNKQQQKWIRVIGENGNIDWDRRQESVKFFDATTNKQEVFKEKPGIRAKKPDGTYYSNKEDMYIQEMKDFFDAVQGIKPYPFTLEDDLARLRIVEKIEESAVTGRKINV